MQTQNGSTPRLTRHRRAVLETVAAQGDHPDAAQVYVAVRQQRPRIAVGTVYAALHYLVDHGLLAAVRRPDGVLTYDRQTLPHDHALCRVCGRLVDVPAVPVHERAAGDYGTVATQTGFTIERHRSEFIGICPECRAKAEE